jgi:hypothetical protein
VSEIAQAIAKRAGSKLVLVSNYETIWFDPSADITDEVISIIRARGTQKPAVVNTTPLKKLSLYLKVSISSKNLPGPSLFEGLLFVSFFGCE